MSTTSYKPGDWCAVCDVCGFEFMASQLKKRWDNVMVCDKDFELRHPQELLRGKKERISPPWTRPEPADVFITVDYVASTVGVQASDVPNGHFDNDDPL